MDTTNWIEAKDKGDWVRIFNLPSRLAYIGSGATDDVVLDSGRGGLIAPRHLQVVPTSEGGCRLINLGGGEVTLDGVAMATRAAVPVQEGSVVRVGDFTLTFHTQGGAPVSAKAVSTSGGATRRDENAMIGLSVTLSELTLTPDQPIQGTVVVRNLGNVLDVQFMLELLGLETDCYQIGPGPILFPGDAKDVHLRIVHPRRPTPPAGNHQIVIRATAPDAYVGQKVEVAQTIRIMPFYAHKMRFI